MTEGTAITHTLDGVDFLLAQHEDLSFLGSYGRVFRVFDDHDSGNISFGLDDGNRKRFIKLAGANTVRTSISPGMAITNLRRAEQIYRDLAHPNIVSILEGFERVPYFGLVFDWAEGELLRRIDISTFERFRMLPLIQRLMAFDTVIDVMQHTHHSGYVAIDLYDASFLYDFDEQHLTICDIDVFERKPVVNTMGRMWGSSRFMSPEEYELGAPIDEITNVYTLGAVCFLFFGDERERSVGNWDAGPHHFNVATRAVSEEREHRYQSVVEFTEAWRQDIRS